MWDSHFRVGGAVGSDLQLSDCPKLSGSVNAKCKAASMLLHLTSESCHFENVWAWVADHDLDQAPNVDSQIGIYSARGILSYRISRSNMALRHRIWSQYSLPIPTLRCNGHLPWSHADRVPILSTHSPSIPPWIRPVCTVVLLRLLWTFSGLWPSVSFSALTTSPTLLHRSSIFGLWVTLFLIYLELFLFPSFFIYIFSCFYVYVQNHLSLW